MPPVFEAMPNEFHEEAAVTKRILERVPADKLTWKPHPRSMSLGQLPGTPRRRLRSLAPLQPVVLI